MRYDSQLTVREARSLYLEANGFSVGEYKARWVRFKLGPVPVIFPSTASRRAAIPLHDLHHVATEYDTDVRGEAEIGAWELAAGCSMNRAALFLNFFAAVFGMVISPRRTVRAWRRGKKSRTLYPEGFDEGLLDLTVAELRAKVRID